MISLREVGSRIDSAIDSVEIGTTGARVHVLENSHDNRGGLAIVDFSKFKPFLPRRVFYSFGIPEGQTRGQHAHKACLQFFVCIGGECSVEIDNGLEIQQIRLDSPIYGISLPRMVWSSQFDFTENASLLVFASDFYAEDDYVRDHEEFRRSVASSS